jgi:hypothetical protein
MALQVRWGAFFAGLQPSRPSPDFHFNALGEHRVITLSYLFFILLQYGNS